MKYLVLFISSIFCYYIGFGQIDWSGVYEIPSKNNTSTKWKKFEIIKSIDSVDYNWILEYRIENGGWKYKGKGVSKDSSLILYVESFESGDEHYDRKTLKKIDLSKPAMIIQFLDGKYVAKELQWRKRSNVMLIKT